MASRIRGQETTLQILVDGEPQVGSWVKVNDFTVTARQEITEEEYLGEDATDHDFRHSGWDLAFSLNMEDASTISFLEDIVSREALHLPHPNITINATYAFRDGQTQVMESYYDVFLMISEQSAGGRTEFVTVSVEGKAKRRNVLQLA